MLNAIWMLESYRVASYHISKVVALWPLTSYKPVSHLIYGYLWNDIHILIHEQNTNTQYDSLNHLGKV